MLPLLILYTDQKSVYVISSMNLFSNFNYTKFVKEVCEILYYHTIEAIQSRKRNVSENKDFLKNMFKGHTELNQEPLNLQSNALPVRYTPLYDEKGLYQFLCQ